MEEKRHTSLYLSKTAWILLAGLARKWGITKSATLEMIIRLMAKQEGIAGEEGGQE